MNNTTEIIAATDTFLQLQEAWLKGNYSAALELNRKVYDELYRISIATQNIEQKRLISSELEALANSAEILAWKINTQIKSEEGK